MFPIQKKVFPSSTSFSPTTEFGAFFLTWDPHIDVSKGQRSKESRPLGMISMWDEFKGKIAIERWYPYWV